MSVYELHYLGVPDIQNYDWENLVYEKKNEHTTPAVLLPPLYKYIVIIHCFDASLIHDVYLRNTVTSIVQSSHNSTPVDWYCKKEST